jgi:hypothetical protein
MLFFERLHGTRDPSGICNGITAGAGFEKLQVYGLGTGFQRGDLVKCEALRCRDDKKSRLNNMAFFIEFEKLCLQVRRDLNC